MGIIYNCAEYQPKENSLFDNGVWIFSNIANFKGMKNEQLQFFVFFMQKK